MKKYLLILACFFITGCSFNNKVNTIYNDAVIKDKNIVIIKDGALEDIKLKVNKHFSAWDYKKVIYTDPEQDMYVLARDISFLKALFIGSAYPYKIILKYSKTDEGKTKVELVNGAQIFLCREEVDSDIRKISELIIKY